MPRIFKGSESTLRLLISKTGDYQALTGIKIKLYTTDIENAIEIIDGIEVYKNIATITLAPRAFMGMEDGLINYIIDGATEDDVFHTERQSNYMLKTLSYINEDGVATQTMTIDSNGEYRVTPNDGLYVDINVNVEDVNGSYDEGFNVGYEQGKTDGINEQKDKLEPINITENGTYTKEDGYNLIEVNVPDLNGSYDEGYAEGEQEGYNTGYEQGQADVVANARVLEVTENGQYGDGETLYKTINVNVIPKVNLAAEGIKFGYCNFETVPQWADFENITNTRYFFQSCSNLKSIEWFNTELVDNASYMFANCTQLESLPNNFNFGNCTDMDNFFSNTLSLNDYTFLETWVINPMAKMNQMISNTNATYVPAIPCVGNTDYNESAIFWSYSEYSKLTYFGGWIGRKYNITKDQILKKLSNLTYESCISILNNLYDFTGNGETPGSNQGTLKVHQNFLDTVGEDILIGINKGWTITV